MHARLPLASALTLALAVGTTAHAGDNLPPSISPFAPLAVVDPTPSEVDFTVSDPDDALTELTVTATSNAPGVLPNGGLVLSGAAGERTLEITPIGIAGNALITLTVSDPGGASATTTLNATIVCDGDADEDELCDSIETDDDNDTVLDEDDLDPTDPLVCQDEDGDGCDDCAGGTPDPDNDGLDSDGDGLCDEGDEDDDGDGTLDVDEAPGDSDGDGIPDVLDPEDQDGPEGDLDGDGLSNQDEDKLGTDPDDPDSDGDGLSNGVEDSTGTDPNDPDTDGDGLEDGEEAGHGTHPNNPDSDDDGQIGRAHV